MPSINATEPSISRESRLAQAVDEFLARQAAGDTPSIDSFTNRYPDLAAELPDVLGMLDALAGMEDDADSSDGAVARSRILGDFRLIRELGRGGMGIVYEAEQLSLARRVALKILPFAAVLDPRHLQRFKNEALAAAHLDHPNIVEVYAVGCERGVHFYAMRYIEGQTLADVIEAMKDEGQSTKDESSRLAPRDEITSLPSRGEAGRGVNGTQDCLSEASNDVSPNNPLRPSSFLIRTSATETSPIAALSTLRTTRPRDFYRHIAELGIQAAEALDHAHQMGIVHRDIKPSNLMLDASGKLWITDFGLARFQNESGMTMTGDLVGTLRYMSPEQALAKRITVDHRADLYSLGVTFYELITLLPLFPGDDRETLLRHIAFDEPVAPRKINSAIPSELETVILKAMAKHPDERYASARELADDLRSFVEQKPIKAKSPSPWQRAQKWARRHQAAAASAFLVLLLATVAFATSTILISKERNSAIAAGEDADRERQRAETSYLTAREAVQQMLFQVGDERLGGIREMKDVRSKVLDDAVRFFTKLIEINPRDAQAYAERADALRLLGRFPEAFNDYETSLKLEPNNMSLHLVVCENIFRWRNNPHRFDIGLWHAKRATEIDPGHALARWYYAVLIIFRGAPDEGRKELKRFDEMAPRTSDTYYRLGFAYWEIGDRDLGLQHTRRAIELDPRNFDAHALLGMIMVGLGKLDAALKEFDEALRLNAYHHSGWGNHVHWRRAGVLIELGRYQEAIEDCDRAIDIEPWYAYPYRLRALAQFHMGHYSQALADFSKAFELRPLEAEIDSLALAMSSNQECRKGILDFLGERTLREDYKQAAYRTRGLIYWKLGLHDEAQSDFGNLLGTTKSDHESSKALKYMAWTISKSPSQETRGTHYVLELTEKAVGFKSNEETLNTLGVAQYRAGRFREAIESLKKSHELDGGKNAGFNLYWLAMAHWQLGENEKGRELYQQAITWTEEHQPKNEELVGFRAEAEKLMGASSAAVQPPGRIPDRP